ncbi:MAG: glyoxalase/bleomycin resistance/dioxygenase family protein [Halobacteria archaeon]|nr:glyoxalase/bleomycin resistance/dioxygenase family protein [Halobacteria archaeon]
MSRFHIHVAVNKMEQNIRFYSAIFGAEPNVIKDDYAKWSLEDPRINFAISRRGQQSGIDHLGIQTESEEELSALQARLDAADIGGAAQADAACCYARSNKYWSMDPQGIAWEAFHTLDTIPTFNEESDAAPASTGCCVPGTISTGCC